MQNRAAGTAWISGVVTGLQQVSSIKEIAVGDSLVVGVCVLYIKPRLRGRLVAGSCSGRSK
jgi:hypothetical protein